MWSTLAGKVPSFFWKSTFLVRSNFSRSSPRKSDGSRVNRVGVTLSDGGRRSAGSFASVCRTAPASCGDDTASGLCARRPLFAEQTPRLCRRRPEAPARWVHLTDVSGIGRRPLLGRVGSCDGENRPHHSVGSLQAKSSFVTGPEKDTVHLDANVALGAVKHSPNLWPEPGFLGASPGRTRGRTG